MSYNNKNFRYFRFNWQKNSKYGPLVISNDIIIASDAKAATNLFMRTFGNLKKNTINYIQEFDPNTKKEIGEPIVPDNEHDTIPAVKVTSVEKKATK